MVDLSLCCGEEEEEEGKGRRLVCGGGEVGKVFICEAAELLVLGGEDAIVASVCSSSSSSSSSPALSSFRSFAPAAYLPKEEEEEEEEEGGGGGGGGGGGEVTFLVDSMLGRLCRWLRVLGWDVVFHDFNLPSILSFKTTHHLPLAEGGGGGGGGGGGVPPILSLAHRMGRVVLTRDKRLAQSRFNSLLGVTTHLVEGNDTQYVFSLSIHPPTYS